MSRILAIFALLLIALAATVATDRPLPRADLRIIDIADFNTLDPQRMSYLQDLRMAYAIYEPLVRWDNDTFDIEPACATSWSISGDRLTYTFHITPLAKWSDGSPVTAHDFVYAWRRAILPDTAADYAGLFFRIASAEDFFNFRSDQLNEYSTRPASQRTKEAAQQLRAELLAWADQHLPIRAIDDQTFQVTLASPTPYFLDLCCFGPFCPVHKQTVESFVSIDPASAAIRQDHTWTKPKHIVTNGPYTPTNWRFKREMRLEANPAYWQPERIKSQSISIIPIEDNNTAVLAYQTGAADWMADVTVDYVADMIDARKQGKDIDIQALSSFGTYFWSFNCSPTLSDGRANPFHDPRVRRAFAMSVDKKAIVEKVKRSGEKVANVLVPPGSIPGFNSPEGLGYDPSAARALFAEAGWQDRDVNGVAENEQGVDFPTVEMLCTQTAYHASVAQAMGRMWEENLAIKTKVVVRETKVYRDNLKRKDYMMARGGWYGDYGDPTTYLDLHRTGDGNNDRAFTNEYFDSLLAKAERELDTEARMRLLEEAERFTMQEALPILPIWHYNYYYLFKDPTDKDGNPNPGGLRGITTHPRLTQYLWELEVVQ